MIRCANLPVLAAKAAIVAGWVALALYIVRAYVPSPLPVGLRETRNVLMVLPEGWGYFTRNPREPVLQFYRLDGQLEPVFMPNSSARNLFGLRRDSRKLSGEAAIVVAHVGPGAWRKTRERLSSETLPDSIVVVHNPTENPMLCGDFLVQLQDRLPWAWAKSRDRIVMPQKVAHVRIVCE